MLVPPKTLGNPLNTLSKFPEAAVLGLDGFYSVNYNLIDVTFKEV